MTTITVREVIQPSDGISESADRVARLVAELLRRNEVPVVVTMRGVRGVPSTFFNAVLKGLHEEFGDTGLARVQFEFDSELQRATYDRALQAALSA